MTRCVFAIPGGLEGPAGGYVYARKVLPLLAARMETQICPLPAGFPFPSDAELQETARALSSADRPGTAFLIDGLAFGAMPADLILGIRSPAVALIHNPLALDGDLSAAERARFFSLEGAALALARSVIVPSPATARELAWHFGVPAEKIAIAEPGILRGRRALGSPPGEPLHIVSVGTLTPRKGFDVLVRAMGEVRALAWRATIAGSLDVAPATVAEVQQEIAACGLNDRVRFAGQLDEAAVSALYSSADIFALASYYEGYGMAFAEAMAHGLPIVASGSGAVAGTVPVEAGFVCAPGDAGAIAAALRTLLSDAALRRAKAEAAWQHGQTLPAWPATAAIIAGALERAAS